MSTLAKSRFSIATSPQFATPLHTENTCEGHSGRLAAFASHRSRPLWYSPALNIFTALERNDRVCQIKLEYFTSSKLGMSQVRKQLPELTGLWPECDTLGPILPNSFLGGAAPLLRPLGLYNVQSPGLPKLLLSITHLVKLDYYKH